ncbi:hypothetical protein HZB88_02095 [archaeon]|nr:hypothetical protein [archaeon]
MNLKKTIKKYIPYCLAGLLFLQFSCGMRTYYNLPSGKEVGLEQKLSEEDIKEIKDCGDKIFKKLGYSDLPNHASFDISEEGTTFYNDGYGGEKINQKLDAGEEYIRKGEYTTQKIFPECGKVIAERDVSFIFNVNEPYTTSGLNSADNSFILNLTGLYVTGEWNSAYGMADLFPIVNMGFRINDVLLLTLFSDYAWSKIGTIFSGEDYTITDNSQKIKLGLDLSCTLSGIDIFDITSSKLNKTPSSLLTSSGFGISYSFTAMQINRLEEGTLRLETDNAVIEITPYTSKSIPYSNYIHQTAGGLSFGIVDVNGGSFFFQHNYLENNELKQTNTETPFLRLILHVNSDRFRIPPSDLSLVLVGSFYDHTPLLDTDQDVVKPSNSIENRFSLDAYLIKSLLTVLKSRESLTAQKLYLILGGGIYHGEEKVEDTGDWVANTNCWGIWVFDIAFR